MNHCELGLLLQNPRESLKKQSVLGKQENIELRAHGVLILSRPVLTVDSTTIEKVAPLLRHICGNAVTTDLPSRRGGFMK